MKKKLAFLLGTTPNLGFAAGNVALGINKHTSSKDYDIVVYYTDLSEQDKTALGKIPHVILKQFNLPDDFVAKMLANIPEQSRFRTSNRLYCFCHFEVLALLDKYENVAWIDLDTSVQRDISSIADYAPFGIASDIPWKTKDQFSEPIKDYDMEAPAYCSAVMVVNDSLPYKKLHKWCYEKAVKYARYLKNPDQAIFAIMCQEFKISPNIMDIEEWQCISWKDKANIARIAHFGCEDKVWNTSNICNAFPEWYRTHLEWLELGGSDFNQSNIQPKNIKKDLDTLDCLISSSNQPVYPKKQKCYLFGCIPLFKIREVKNKKKFYLFNFIPLFKIVTK